MYGKNLRVEVVKTFPVEKRIPIVKRMREAVVMEKKTFHDAGKRPYTKEMPRKIILSQPIELGREWKVKREPYFVIKPVVWMSQGRERKAPTWTLTIQDILEGILRYLSVSENTIKGVDWTKQKIQNLAIKLINLWRENKFNMFHAQFKELFV
jgi:hypothetical protein